MGNCHALIALELKESTQIINDTKILPILSVKYLQSRDFKGNSRTVEKSEIFKVLFDSRRKSKLFIIVKVTELLESKISEYLKLPKTLVFWLFS